MRRVFTLGALMLVLLGCEEDDTGAETAETGDTDTGSEAELASFEVTGWVEDDDGHPVAEANVLVGGREDTLVYTDADGAFSLWYTETGFGEPAIVASKAGYRAKGMEFFQPDSPFTLVLRALNGPDNLEYNYQDPGDGFDHLKEDCSHCHTGFVLDFVRSKHAEAAQNPLLQDLYAGVSLAYMNAVECEDAGGRWASGLEPGTEGVAVDKCYLEHGVLTDLNSNCGGDGQLQCDDVTLSDSEKPTAFGACADCHAPGIDGVAGGRNLHDAVGLAYDIGVHCDTCHKVSDIDMSKPPGVGQRLVMGRPSEPGRNTFEWDPVYYGPLIDVANVAMGGSPQPKFNESVFCAGCHEQAQPALVPGDVLDETRWPEGLPVHSTYEEWKAGPYNQEATPCQFCHMPANVERTNSVDIATVENQSITFGFAREPEDIRRHIFRSPLQGEPRLIDTAVYTSVNVERQGDEVVASVSVANIGCGHAIPTGEPMRSLLLLVEATGEGACGTLQPMGGLTVPDTGGAWSVGIEGETTTTLEADLEWPEGASVAEAGHVVRVVRPTGDFLDYTGVGFFDNASLTAEEKGIPIEVPVGEAEVLIVDGDVLTLSAVLDIQLGDRVYLGDPVDGYEDGQDARHLAGRAGTAFSRVLVDSEGTRHVPHYRAVDMVSDNRIAPGAHAVSTYRFALNDGCDVGHIQATVLYRPIPLSLAFPRDWESKDYVIATGTGSW